MGIEQAPKKESPENFIRPKLTEPTEEPASEKKEEMISLSDEDLLVPLELEEGEWSDTRETDKILVCEKRISEIKKQLPFLSGRNKKNAESDLARCRAEQKEMLGFIISGIEKTPGGKKYLDVITPTDPDTLENGRYAGGSDEEQRKYTEAVDRKNDLFLFLWDQYGFKINLAECVYGEAALRRAEAAGLPKPEKKPEKLPYEYFDPAGELEKIGKFSEEEAKLPAREKTKIKKERLAEFKERTAEQMVGIAKINGQIESMVLGQGITDKRKLESFLLKKAEAHGLSPAQVARYRHSLAAIEGRAKKMDTVAEKYAGWKTDKLFVEFFGFAPKGEVKIEKRPLCFCITCDDIRDYSMVLSGKDDDQAIERSQKSGGFAGGNNVWPPDLWEAVVVINAGSLKQRFANENLRLFSRLHTVRIHEEKHILHGLTKDAEDLGFYQKLPKEVRQEVGKKVLGESMKATRLAAEKRAKNEILAYLKDGSAIKSIEENLLRREADDGLYDYLEGDKKNYSSPYSFPSYDHFDRDLIDKEHEKTRKEYEKNVKDGLEITGKLLRVGYPRKEVAGLFETEPLSVWPKFFKRLREGKDFRARKAIAIEDVVEMLALFNRERKKQNEELARELKKKPEYQDLGRQEMLREGWRQSYENCLNAIARKGELEKL